MKVKSWPLNYLFEREGKKWRLKKKNAKKALSILAASLALIQFSRTPDDSDLSQVYRPFQQFENHKKILLSPQGITLQSEAEANAKKEGLKPLKLPRPKEIIYSGKQVLERSGADGLLSPLASGANFIGKLISFIDTRVPGQVVRVTLPYGARHPKGGSLPRHSILYGTSSPEGESEKVFLRFHKVEFPDGKEYRIDAQALNSADYSPGIVGIKHGNTDLKVASSMGLTMISAASDILTQRSSLGALGGIPMGVGSPDATVKNAILQGVSQVSRQEAQKEAQNLGNVSDYVTVPEGSDLIISLLSPFNGEAI